MKFLANLINRFYKIIIILSIVIFVAFFVVASGLTINSNMEDLLPGDSSSVIAQKQMEQAFEGTETAIILLKGSREEVLPILESLGPKLESLPEVSQVLYKIDLSQMGNKTVLYLNDEFKEINNLISSINNEESYNNLIQYIQGLSNRNHDNGIKYLEADSGDAWIIELKPKLDGDYAEGRESFYKEVQRVLNIALQENPNIVGGITGGMFIADYESDTVAFSGMDKTFLITLALITIFLIFSFRRLKTPLLALYPLLGGALGAAALARVVFGSLNMFSSSFALLLLGLGIDFAIHLSARFYEEIENGEDIDSAIQNSLTGTGLSIIIGALTTAFAFLAFLIADFKAFVQMGLVSGMGVIVIGLIMLILMPSLLRATGGKALKLNSVKKPKFVKKLYLPFLITFLIGMFFLIPNVLDTKVVGDINKLYPDNIPSNYWSKELKNSFGIGGETLGVVVNSVDELEKYQRILNSSPLVESTKSILDYIPREQDDKLDIINKLSVVLKSVGVSSDEINNSFPTNRILITDLPKELQDLYIGKNKNYLLEIIPKFNISQTDEYKKIKDEIILVTGKSPGGLSGIMNEIVGLVKNDIYRICLICLAVILIFLWFVFKKPILVLVTISPILLSIYFTLGLLNVFSIDINVFSIAAFPLIIGIGIDGGIHLMHRLISDTTTNYKLIIIHTNKAIITTSVTTILGFGSLGLINHPGMANLGLTVALGVGLSLLFTILIIPFYFILLNRRKDSIEYLESSNNEDLKKYV